MADTTATTGQISLDDFRSALLVNWDEAFTNVTGIFLDQGTSMFETLATISAEEASRPVGGGCTTIAAQVNHTWFYLDLMNRDPLISPVRGIFAAQQLKPQARTLAHDRGIETMLIDYDALRGMDNAEDRLF